MVVVIDDKRTGYVRYIGHLDSTSRQSSNEVYVGLELVEPGKDYRLIRSILMIAASSSLSSMLR